jgi:hypothetical protein
VQVKVIAQGLIPGVKDSQKADLAVQMGPSEVGQCFGNGFEEDGEQDFLVGENQRIQFVGECENKVEVPGRQKVGLLALEPLFSGVRSTLGAMPVTARVVGGTLKATAVTPLQMSAESFSAANLNGVNNLKMSSRQLVTLAIGFTIETENIGEFPSRPEFSCPVQCG